MKRKNYRAIIALMVLFCLIWTVDILAQEKKNLVAADYELWKTAPKIINAETSEDGAWYAYKVGIDTLIDIHVKNIKGGVQYNLKAKITSKQNNQYTPHPKKEFSKDSKWYAFISSDSLQLLDLNSGKRQIYKGIYDFSFVGGGKYLLGQGGSDKDKKVILIDLRTQSLVTIDHVKELAINSSQLAMAAVITEGNQTQVKAVTFVTGFPTSLIATSQDNFNKLTWNKTGTGFTFYETGELKMGNEVRKIYVCTDFGRKSIVKSMNPLEYPNCPKDYNLQQRNQLHLSDDGKQMFFYLIKNDVGAKVPKAAGNGIEVWLPDALTIPGFGTIWQDRQLWYSWQLEDNKLIAVTDTTYRYAVLTGDEKKALIYNKKDYLPQHNYVNPFMDFYIKDLATGNLKLLLKKVMDQPEQLLVSPGGKYVAYFKEKNWWVYDIYQDKHQCVTAGIKATFENVEIESVGTVRPYGNPGWLTNDSQLIVYDQFDIWVISPDGKNRVKITNGVETNKTFRIWRPQAGVAATGPGNSWFKSKAYDGKEGFLITSLNKENLDNGLHFWKQKTGLTELIVKPRKLTHYGQVKYNQPFLYEERDFDVPPRLMLYDPAGHIKLLYETNPQHKNFKWGKSELVHYATADGKQLKGALFYPADYVAGKLYPMVVEIYERQANLYLHDYQIPSLSMGESNTMANITNYTSEGYFAFYPDISYELNDPGISATRCVVAAVEKVIRMGLVDKSRIGLIGHSFGGYETAFIVTQTDIFKTAIASSGITDVPTFSLLVSSFGPNFERVEQDQFRMNRAFLGADYQRNSPMHHVNNLKTPIFLWTGDKDVNVDPSQTKTFHLALWRLGKKSTMVLYEGEDHVLQKPKNQIDVTCKIKNWFDHYLKGEKAAEWMVNGVGIGK